MNNCSKCGAELPEGVKYCEKCGEGSIGAMLDLANKYREGKGVTRNVNRAFVLAYEAIAKGGKSRTFTTLGRFYQLGDFAERDYQKANELFCRSANAGSHYGLYWLGLNYLRGHGVAKNQQAAKFLLEKAIEQGSKSAQDEIKKIDGAVKSDKSEVQGYTGEPDTSPLPDFLNADYEKAKVGTLWTEEFEKHKEQHKGHCNTCNGKGVVQCTKCEGKKEYKCSYCSGRGHLSFCGCKDGKVKCESCDGTGKVSVDCPVCDYGYVTKARWINCGYCHGKGYTTYERSNGETGKKDCYHCGGRGQVKEAYKELCPNCHGDYCGFKGEVSCKKCSGTGQITCPDCNGSGEKKCPCCDGKGKFECKECNGTGTKRCPECLARSKKKTAIKREKMRPSHQKRDIFFLLGMTLGLLGVHYAYIRRWRMCVAQMLLTVCGGAQFVMPWLDGWFHPILSPLSAKLSEMGVAWLGNAIQYPILFIAVLWWLIGVGFIRRDGTNHKVSENWPTMWLFVFMTIIQLTPIVLVRSLLPAIFGIHLLYGGNRKLFYANLPLAVGAFAVSITGIEGLYSFIATVIYFCWFVVSFILAAKFVRSKGYGEKTRGMLSGLAGKLPDGFIPKRKID